MKNNNIEEIKEKYEAIQKIGDDLKEKKIRTESALEAMKKELEIKKEELLKITGTESIEEARKKIEEDRSKLEEEVSKLNYELSKYLDSYGE